MTTQEGVADEALQPTPQLNPRNAAIAEIAARAAETRAADVAEEDALYGDLEAQEAADDGEPVAQVAADDPPEQEAAPAEDADPVITVKVNGELRQVRQSELTEVYQKERSATERYQQAAREREEAARMRAEAEAIARQYAPPVAPPAPLDVRAVAEKLQYGSTDEAAQILNDLLVTTQQGAKQATEQVLLQRELEQYRRQNADLFQDPMLRGALESVDEHLAKHDPEWSAKPLPERWNEAANRVRERFGVQQATPTPGKPVAAVVSQDRAARKATITNVPTASGRRAEPQAPRPPTTSELIERERARRMKGRVY